MLSSGPKIDEIASGVSLPAAGTRRAMLAALLMGAGAALAACGPSGSPPKPPEKGAAASGAAATSIRPALIYTGIVSGVAVGGFDPVAYFTDGKPVRGEETISLQHDGVSWRFASAKNRDAFRANPSKYAPQYGGHCAWAVANGSTAKGDPTVWSITDGKLYLNLSAGVQRSWQQDVPGNIRRADAAWPRIAAR